MNRSESDVVAQTSMIVMLGEKKHEVKPLSILKARAWREKVAVLVEKIVSRVGALESPEKLTGAIRESPQEMIEIVASYLNMSDEELLATEATEMQISYAFGAVMGLAFSPFLAQQQIMKHFQSELLMSLPAPSSRLH